MHRSRKIIILCHCLLNANAKVYPLALYPGVLPIVISEFLAKGVGVIQLPCPETSFLGLCRWGMTYEQYDHATYRRHCRDILSASIDQIEALSKDGCEILGLVGIDGSPSCGAFVTCKGYKGGEASSVLTDISGQIDGLQMISGQGVFLQELLALLNDRNLDVPLLAVDENNPETLTTTSRIASC